jgi:hypothetical protein
MEINACKVSVGNLSWRLPEHSGIDGRIIMKWTKAQAGLIYLQIRTSGRLL